MSTKSELLLILVENKGYYLSGFRLEMMNGWGYQTASQIFEILETQHYCPQLRPGQ